MELTRRVSTNVVKRLYWPKETTPSILDGTWEPPPAKPVTPRTPLALED